MSEFTPTSKFPGSTLVHVAAANEHRGRVVVALHTPLPSRVAADLAVDLARLFSARVDAVYLDDQQLAEATAHTFACEIGLNGRMIGPLDKRRLEAERRSARTAALTAFRNLTCHADVSIDSRAPSRVDRISLGSVCADEGPWNIVVFADQSHWPSPAGCAELLDGGGATALVMAGRRARRRPGPPLLLISEPDRLPVMLRTARILSELTPDVSAPALLLPVPTHAAASDFDIDLEGTLRLAISAMPDASAPKLVRMNASVMDVATELDIVERHRPAFILAHTSDDEAATAHTLRLIATASCPALVVR